jgi:preprotein translocase subunit YajC
MPAVMPLPVQQRLFWQWVPERLPLCRSMRYYAEKREPLWQNHTATEKGLLNMSKNFARLGLAASTAALTGAVCSVTAFAESGSGKSASGSGFGTVGYLIFMVLLFAVMYFILIRPQKKKDKEAKAMQSSLQVGDEIVTIGGIVGLVVQVNEDNIVIETTGNRNKIRLKNWAVQENLTMTENAKRKQEAQIAAAKEKRAGKKKKKDSDDSDQGMLKD